jgi:glycosyltransferase involved in cell wall biosynthesis
VAYAQLNPELVRIIAPSAWIQGEARKSALLSNFDVVHIRTGVNGRLFSPKNRAKARQKLGLPLDAKVILTVAVDIESHRKGWNLLVQAVSKLQAKDVVVATVGQQSSASGDVKILKPLGRLQTEDELSEAYSAADLFVLPTREDNLPNVLLEAMACGTPCVSFDVGGVSEAIRHGETGLLAGPEDTDGLARAMDALLTENALRERFGSQARALALAEFDAKALSAKYLELYETLAERARALATGESSRL